MNKYLFGEHVYSSADENWQRVLQKARAAKLRPVCLCRAQGEKPALYVALFRGEHILKRLPYSGPLHAPHCAHYEPPPELSGLGQVTGSAIRETMETESTALALDFALNKGRSRQVGVATEIEHESVRSDGTKLTMRGLLHYLFDEAGLTRWTPAMAGKRSWFVVRRELLKGASAKTTKGLSLPEVLFIPESFVLKDEADIKLRQIDALARLSSSATARMIVIGEVKAIEEARYGKCLVVKHLPELKLMMNDDLHKHLLSRFEQQLQLWAQLDTSHLLTLSTVSRSAQGVYSLEAICLMNVNEHWIPFETLFEWELLTKLHADQRRFTKGLRYNLPTTKPLACAVLLDTGDVSTAMYVIPAALETQYVAVMDELTSQSKLAAWQWRAGTEAMPTLPLRAVGQHERPPASTGHRSNLSNA
jgi:Protein of unknown function (DUF1173)